jgi:hypothetical protein
MSKSVFAAAFVLSIAVLSNPTQTATQSFSDPRPICDPNDPRCKPPIPPLDYSSILKQS